MTRKLFLFALTLTIATWPFGRANADVQTVLAGVPQDAAGFICLPNLKVLDADVQQQIAELGLDAMMPPPMNSLVTMLKMNMPMLAGLDESKPVAFVIMPIQSMTEFEAKSALVFSAADPNALLQGLGGSAGDDGIWNVSIMGQAQAATIKGNQVILGKMADTVKAIASGNGSVAAKVNKHDAADMSDLDLIVWFDGPKLFTPLKPQLNGILMMAMMQAQASGQMTAANVEQTRQNFEELIDGMHSAMIGLSVRNEGIGLRGSIAAKPGSDFAKKFRIATTESSMLNGLSGAPFLMAAGHVCNAEQAQIIADELTDALAVGKDVEGVDQDQMKQFVGLWTDAIKMYRGMRFSLQGLEPGPGGLFGMTKVVDVTDGQRLMDIMQEAFLKGKGLAQDAAKASDAADADMVSAMLEALTFSKDQEQVGGASVAQLRFDMATLAKLGDLDENDVSMVTKIIGEEGLLFRAAVVDKNTVVVGFGGGKDRFASTLAQVREDKAPLEASDGIKKLNKELPKARAAVMYVSADEIVKTVQNVQRAVGEPPLPVQMPKLNAPLAISTTGVGDWSRADLFIPIDLIRAGKDAAMASASAP